MTGRGNSVAEDVIRTLVVEDDPALRGIYGDALRQSGYEVRVAADGREALAIMDAGWTPSVAFFDLRMSGMDGWEFARRVRADRRWAHVRLVVIAAHVRIDREAREIGAAAWLQKPFDLDRLDEQARMSSVEASA
ncbi:MAG TPA: response regulator [Candidatus Limnocylindrales bacterium]|nr:response regulator [Candidatus Limnocylindrales bacterium]